MKKVVMGLLTLSIVASGAFLGGCKEPEDPSDLKTPKAEADGYVSLDINPSIELVVDQYGKVMSVYGSNDDARVLLYDETGIVGKTIEEAVAKITTLAKELGYLNEDNDVISVLSSGLDNSKLNSINSTITATAQNLGLSVSTDAEGAYSLYRDFEAFKSEHPGVEAIQNLTISKYKLALSVSETGDISLDEAVLLDDSELIDMLDNNLDKVEVFMTEEFNKARLEAEGVFEQAKVFAQDIAYVTWFSENMANNPLNSYKGALYTMYHATGKGFDLVADVVERSKQIETHELSGEQVSTIVTALELSNSDVLKDENGKITIESVEAYLDNLFKDNPSQDWSTVKEEINGVLTTIEGEVDQTIGVVKESFYGQLNTVFTQTEGYLATLKNMQELLNDTPSGEELARYISDYEEIANQIKAILEEPTSSLDVDELKAHATTLLEKAELIKTDLEADLTDAQKAEIEALKQLTLATLNSASQALNLALENAETNALATLANLKASRIVE